MNDHKNVNFDNIKPKLIFSSKATNIQIKEELSILEDSMTIKVLETGKNKTILISALILSILLFSIYIIFGLTIQSAENSFKYGTIERAPTRGKIIDRNNHIISATIDTKDLYLDPKKVLNVPKVLNQLNILFPEKKDLLIKFLKHNKYKLVEKHLTENQEFEIKKLGEPGLIIESSTRRIYPQSNLFSQITGFLSKHGKPMSKIEKQFNNKLSKGKDIFLTLDIKLQNIMKEEISIGLKKFNAKNAGGLIMDVDTGDILSMVSLPDYDPNYPSQIKPFTENNIITSARYEMGSTLKTFNIAMTLKNKTVSSDELFDISEPYKLTDKYLVHDISRISEPVNLTTIFKQSSNIGAVKIYERNGREKQKNFFKLVGLTDHTEVRGVQTIRNKFPKNWNETKAKSISFGYAASITPISLASSFSTLINGGYKLKPNIILEKEKKKDLNNREKIISNELSSSIVNLLHEVVKDGTAKNAKVLGIEVGGKTGTARKSINGHYNDQKIITSFIGFFPIERPKYLSLIIFDEPRINKEESDINLYGGNTAAPIFSKIVERSSSILKIWPKKQDSKYQFSEAPNKD